jgi:FHA domain
MVKKRPLGTMRALPVAATLLAMTGLAAAAAQDPPSVPEVRQAKTQPPPLLIGVVLDEAGMAAADLRRSRELVLALMDVLPQGSEVMVSSFAGEKRIVLARTAERALVTTALDGVQAGASGAALPDGLFDVVEYIGAQEVGVRALLLFSAGRVRDGDLQFEDPLNAATAKGIPIFALALGQGEGKLLRRVAKITGGEYVRLEVADAAILARWMLERGVNKAQPAAAQEAPETSSSPSAPSPATGLLGAAAVFFSIGGLLMLGIVVLLIRRMGAADPPRPAAPVPPTPSLALTSSMPRKEPHRLALDSPPGPADDDVVLEQTLVVNASPTLRALSGPGTGKNFPLSATGHTTLGRSRRSDIVVPEEGASAQHCRIDREGDSYVLHDLGSTNGTFLNDARTERAVLQHGDRLRVGGTVFTVSLFGDRT